MTENEDKSLRKNFIKIVALKNLCILKNIYLISPSILNNYVRLYYQDILALFNMEFISKNKISEEPIKTFNEEMNLGLAKNLEKNNYMTSFDDLKDLLYLRELAIKRPNLKSDYMHLPIQEPFNAN